MSDESEIEKPQIEVVGDDDWKDRVKAEDAKLDAAEQADPEDTGAGNNQADGAHLDLDKLPPADFSMMVQMFATQAMVALGVIPSPEGKQLQQLPLAKHFIDLLGVLEEKCKGNLSDDEAKLLEQSAFELRMAYVEMTKTKS